ncbi:hypothetical protein AAVH_36041, partial [Aphelenchoides avenae]
MSTDAELRDMLKRLSTCENEINVVKNRLHETENENAELRKALEALTVKAHHPHHWWNIGAQRKASQHSMVHAARRGPPSDRYMELVYHRIHSRQKTPIYKCHLCNKSEIKGDLAAHKHINNSKHLTKLDSIPAEFKVRNNNSHAHSDSLLVSTPGCPVMHCTACNEDLLGREAVLKHLESQRHTS